MVMFMQEVWIQQEWFKLTDIEGTGFKDTWLMAVCSYVGPVQCRKSMGGNHPGLGQKSWPGWCSEI